MMRWVVLTLLAAGAAGPANIDRPATPDAWLFNAAERTRIGLRTQEEDPAGALPYFDTARRLAPHDPATAFNAGTARLQAGEIQGGAIELLKTAADQAQGELVPQAFYNLGNAYLAADDAAQAVEAYERTLRLAPDHVAAKFNLELALRLQERQQSSSEASPDHRPQEEQPQEQSSQPQAGPGAGEGEEEPEDPPQAQDGSSRARKPERQEQEASSGALPGFEDQADMSAEEAARILEAVENLERSQRRAEAARRARAQRGKDW